MAVPIFLTFQPTLKRSLGLKWVPLGTDCESNLQSSSATAEPPEVGVALGACDVDVFEGKANNKVGVSDRVGSEVADGICVCVLVGLGVGEEDGAQAVRKTASAMKTRVILISLPIVSFDRQAAFLSMRCLHCKSVRAAIGHPEWEPANKR